MDTIKTTRYCIFNHAGRTYIARVQYNYTTHHMHVFKYINICVCERKLIFFCRVLSFIFYWFGMVWGKLTIPERWQAVGMHSGGLSHRGVADHFRANHSIVVRQMQRFRQTGNVTDRPRAGRPRKTTPREDRLISRRARQRPFSTAGALRGNLAFGGHISTRTVIRRLHHQGMRARRPIKCPQLTLRHHHAQFDWSHDHLGWTICTWRRVHWSDESPFCYALPTVVPGFGANETLHFMTTTFWAQLLLGVGV